MDFLHAASDHRPPSSVVGFGFWCVERAETPGARTACVSRVSRRPNDLKTQVRPKTREVPNAHAVPVAENDARAASCAQHRARSAHISHISYLRTRLVCITFYLVASFTAWHPPAPRKRGCGRPGGVGTARARRGGSRASVGSWHAPRARRAAVRRAVYSRSCPRRSPPCK